MCCTSLAQLRHKTCLFWSATSLREWSSGYQLIYQHCGAIRSVGALSIHVSCMQSTHGNPNPTGLNISKGYLLVLDLNVLYKLHA